MAEEKQDRKTVDMWIGSTVNPATVLGGVTAGDEGTKGKFWLKLLINQAQKDEIETKFASEIANAHAQVDATRATKILEFGGAAAPGAQEKANAACMYREWCKPVIVNGAIVPDQFEVTVSQSSVNYQLKKNYSFGVIKVKYYNIVAGKAQLVGTPSDPIGVAIPTDSKVAIKCNMQVTASPNNSGFGLGLGRLAQVFVYEWGEGFGGGEDTLPEGIEMEAGDAAEVELPAHVQAMMAKAPKAKGATSPTGQPGAPMANPYEVNTAVVQPTAEAETPNPYTPAAQASQQAAAPTQVPPGYYVEPTTQQMMPIPPGFQLDSTTGGLVPVAQPAPAAPATGNPYGA